MPIKEELITDFYGRYIGYLRTDEEGNITALDYPSRTPLGIYDIKSNQTLELTSRKPIARGNVVVSFLYKKKK